MAKDKNKNKKPNAAGAPPAGAPAAAGAAKPTTAKADTGKKKAKGKKKGDILQNAAAQPDLSNLSPEQLNQLQLEEAIKESNNPAMKLKKLKSPLNIKSVLIGLLALIVLTLVGTFMYLWLGPAIDKFKFGYVLKDMLSDFGITQAFKSFFKGLGNIFSGKKWGAEIILALFIK